MKEVLLNWLREKCANGDFGDNVNVQALEAFLLEVIEICQKEAKT